MEYVVSKKWERLMDEATTAMQDRNYSEAGRLLKKALPLAEKSGDALDRFETLTALGCALAAGTEKKQAEGVFCRALAFTFLSDELGVEQFGTCTASLANVYFDLERFDESRTTALKALEILDSTNLEDRTMALMPIETLIKLNLRLNEYEEAAALMSSAVSLLERYPSPQKAIFIPALAKRAAQIPESIRRSYEAKWGILQQETVMPVLSGSR